MLFSRKPIAEDASDVRKCSRSEKNPIGRKKGIATAMGKHPTLKTEAPVADFLLAVAVAIYLSM